MSTHIRYVRSLLALSLIAAIAGCSSPARQRSERAVNSLESTRDELTRGSTQIDEVLVTLDQLEARPADLKPVYSKFSGQVRDVEDRSEAMGRRVDDMHLRAAEYSAKWETQNQTISNPDLRATAQERAERVRGRYDTVDSKAQAVRAAYRPLVTELRDLHTFLGNDLTYTGVNAAKPAIEGVRSKAADLKEKIADLVSDLDETYTRLSPTTAPVQ